jgi:hypothetical protein
MFEFAALTYGMLLSFVLTSIGRAKREGRPAAAVTTHFGWVLMSSSATLSVLLFAWAAGLAMGFALPSFPLS